MLPISLPSLSMGIKVACESACSACRASTRRAGLQVTCAHLSPGGSRSGLAFMTMSSMCGAIAHRATRLLSCAADDSTEFAAF